MYPTERKRYIILGAAIGAVFLFFVVVMMLSVFLVKRIGIQTGVSVGEGRKGDL